MKPVIKWKHSKHFKAKELIKDFPKEVHIYSEIYLGSGAVLGEYLLGLEKGKFKCDIINCYDPNKDLIGMWKLIKENPQYILNSYSRMYLHYKYSMSKESKRMYYDKAVRRYNDFNKQHRYVSIHEQGLYEANLLTFYWITRTCLNGRIKFNTIDEFVSPPELTRDPIDPQRLKPLLEKWSYLLNKYDVNFYNKTYNNINIQNKNDFAFIDMTHTKNTTEGGVNICTWLMNINGKYKLLDNEGQINKCMGMC